MTASTPSPCLTLVKTVGPPSRILAASRFMTSSEAPTYCAMSVLLMTSRSDCEMPVMQWHASQLLSLRSGTAILTWPALARHLVATRDINDIHVEVGQLSAVRRGQVVAAALDEEQLRLVLRLQRLERAQVRRDVLADRRVRTAARLDGADAVDGREGRVAVQELLVLAAGSVISGEEADPRPAETCYSPSEDVICHDAEVEAVTQCAAEGEQEGRLARADGPAQARAA